MADETGCPFVSHERPIRLADVLLAIKHEESKRENELNKKLDSPRQRVRLPLFYTAMMAITKCELDGGGFWNLRTDDLTQQPDECIQFLANLLSTHPQSV